MPNTPGNYRETLEIAKRETLETAKREDLETAMKKVERQRNDNKQ